MLHAVEFCLPRGLPFTCIAEGSGVLIVTTPGSVARGFVDRVSSWLPSQARICIYDQLLGYPSVVEAERLLEFIKGKEFDVILGLGGGSAIDAAKIVAWNQSLKAGISFADSLRLDVPHGSKSPPMVVAVPTLPGSGSEVTHFATVWDFAERKKFSIAAPFLRPKRILINTDFSASAPDSALASASIDAISHAMESTWNKAANEKSLRHAAKAIQHAFRFYSPERSAGNGGSIVDLHLASIEAGEAIAVTKTALSHAISYRLTLRMGMQHGLAVGFSLSSVFDSALKSNGSRLHTLASYAGLASVDVLEGELKGVLERLKLNDRIRSHGQDLSAIENDASLIACDERALNTSFNADSVMISEIISESIHRACSSRRELPLPPVKE